MPHRPGGLNNGSLFPHKSDFFWGLCPWLADGIFSPHLHMIFPLCLCPNVLFFQGHQPDWIRVYAMLWFGCGLSLTGPSVVMLRGWNLYQMGPSGRYLDHKWIMLVSGMDWVFKEWVLRRESLYRWEYLRCLALSVFGQFPFLLSCCIVTQVGALNSIWYHALWMLPPKS